ncbi:MAG: hypothetical protein GXP34_06225 [Actinobacteria bacterium]|nr:hypothetical protein [Actinomycetota bacterium]
MPVTNRSSSRPRSRQDAAARAGGVGGAIALALCCGGALLAAALGLGAVAAFLIAPWFIIPVVLLAAGIAYRRSVRRKPTCEVRPTAQERKRR